MKLYSEFFVLKSESGPILTSWDIGCSLAISISYIFLVVPLKGRQDGQPRDMDADFGHVVFSATELSQVREKRT